VVDILRIAGLLELAEEARRVLPDPVEYNHAERFLAQYGITKDEPDQPPGRKPVTRDGRPGPRSADLGSQPGYGPSAAVL
jgi:hypothetical protein